MRIKNTLALENLWVSANIAAELDGREAVSVSEQAASLASPPARWFRRRVEHRFQRERASQRLAPENLCDLRVSYLIDRDLR